MRILWWGRHGNYGPDYPRNRTLQSEIRKLGHDIIEFQPRISVLGALEAQYKGFTDIDRVWVPCFRQRDLLGAAKWAKKRNVPLIFDPLISAYDKQVYEKQKFAPGSRTAHRLHAWEQRVFQQADILIADTDSHKAYFADEFALDRDKIHVIPVSAEEALFKPDPNFRPNEVTEFLFFGTFIGLQGTEFIMQALPHYQGPPIKITLMGEGPDKARCEALAQSLPIPEQITLNFESWVPIEALPARIQQCDVCLGIFGNTRKTQRVIPNKVYQALACGKPVITLRSNAYPEPLQEPNPALIWLDTLKPEQLTHLLAVHGRREHVESASDVKDIYDQYFSNQHVCRELNIVLSAVAINR